MRNQENPHTSVRQNYTTLWQSALNTKRLHLDSIRDSIPTKISDSHTFKIIWYFFKRDFMRVCHITLIGLLIWLGYLIHVLIPHCTQLRPAYLTELTGLVRGKLVKNSVIFQHAIFQALQRAKSACEICFFSLEEITLTRFDVSH